MLPGLFGSAVRAAQRTHAPLLRLSTRSAHTQSRILSALPPALRFTARPTPCSQKSARGVATRVRFFTSTRLTRQSPASPSDLPVPPHTLSNPAVGGWLMLCSAMVFTVVVVGGITRLTESGLSITEWKPVTGVIPPRGAEEWEAEFAKYRETPEYKMLNANMTVDEFKQIFFWEWSHRVLGRLIGVAFVIPAAYFAFRRRLSPGLPLRLGGLSLLLGAQGVIGWYMVKSGLEDEILLTPGAVPRVSQYRLATHLGAALALYAGMFWTGLSVIKDWKFAKNGSWGGYKPGSSQWVRDLESAVMRTFKRRAGALTGIVFLTALSGAFVAGLDAGLVYNEFPYMGESIVPPTDELFSRNYAAKDGTQWWRNLFENPTTVQFNHRVLAVTTYCLTGAFWLMTRRKIALPPSVRRATAVAFAMANVQLTLGLTTLLYMVPVPLAAAHQAGSVALLSAVIHMLIAARRPSAAARAWRTYNAAAASAAPKTASAASTGFKASLANAPKAALA
ncbi:COX15-CtaA-domain-containing protein [Peniophora sp. CONT]|nr:COX15-CtaA-domain-containing protein [Peniophora sp. CONT]